MSDKQEHAKRQITNIFLQLGHLPWTNLVSF
jgi:hypothetical protein